MKKIFFAAILFLLFSNFVQSQDIHFSQFNASPLTLNAANKEVVEGYLPPQQLKLVQTWAIIHEEELTENFKNLNNEQHTWNKIEPLH
jgi:hypothetical protein